MNIKEQIEELQNSIYKLQDQFQEENKAKILPFLQEHATIVYDGLFSTRLKLRFVSEDKKNDFITIMDSIDPGWNHKNIKIDENVTCSYDDGVLFVYFSYIGMTKDIPQKFLDDAKKLRIKVDFKGYLSSIDKDILKLQSSKRSIEELEKQLLS
ncbi:MAG: hypothetical protein EKK57_05680 [Proteobacteria bacterium]|nr:MAG: hypothetical protein EKK57_05680 [Pseudomonadota bacterium]